MTDVILTSQTINVQKNKNSTSSLTRKNVKVPIRNREDKIRLKLLTNIVKLLNGLFQLRTQKKKIKQ